MLSKVVEVDLLRNRPLWPVDCITGRADVGAKVVRGRVARCIAPNAYPRGSAKRARPSAKRRAELFL